MGCICKLHQIAILITVCFKSLYLPLCILNFVPPDCAYTYASGGWISLQGFTYGTFTFSAQSTGSSGNFATTIYFYYFIPPYIFKQELFFEWESHHLQMGLQMQLFFLLLALQLVQFTSTYTIMQSILPHNQFHLTSMQIK
jgi:hypothetical protein